MCADDTCAWLGSHARGFIHGQRAPTISARESPISVATGNTGLTDHRWYCTVCMRGMDTNSWRVSNTAPLMPSQCDCGSTCVCSCVCPASTHLKQSRAHVHLWIRLPCVFRGRASWLPTKGRRAHVNTPYPTDARAGNAVPVSTNTLDVEPHWYRANLPAWVSFLKFNFLTFVMYLNDIDPHFSSLGKLTCSSVPARWKTDDRCNRAVPNVGTRA